MSKKNAENNSPKPATALPNPEQVITERNRLRKGKTKIDEQMVHLKKAPIQQLRKKRKNELKIPSIETVAAERENLRYRASFRRMLGNTIGILLVVAAAAALIATLCLPVMQVSGTSMEPTLSDGDIIVLVKTDNFQTGDLVGLHYNGKIMLKRVIGQAGDYINIDADGNVYVNGVYIDEPYVTGKSLGDCDLVFPYQVPDSTCFVLGDHRSISTDSRNSAIGSIQKDQIIGKIALRIWPINVFSIIQ